jgi:hypothetical protein
MGPRLRSSCRGRRFLPGQLTATGRSERRFGSKLTVLLLLTALFLLTLLVGAARGIA